MGMIVKSRGISICIPLDVRGNFRTKIQNCQLKNITLTQASIVNA